MTEAGVPLIVRRLIPAPRRRIFEVFSRAELLAQWFTPSPDIDLDILDFNFKENGIFRFRYIMPDGRHPVVGGAYERISAPEEIVVSWLWEAPDPLQGLDMRVLFRFHECGDATEVVIWHEKLPSDTACSIHEDGWEGSLDSLCRFLIEPVHTSRGISS